MKKCSTLVNAYCSNGVLNTQQPWSEFSLQEPDDVTFVSIINSGFSGDGDKAVQGAMGAAVGFELILAWLKAYLKRGAERYFINYRFPNRIIDQPASKASNYNRSNDYDQSQQYCG